MSVQHRARIKTVADYSDYLSDEGGCCLPDSGPNDGFASTYQNCISQNGYFIPSEGPWTCPDLATKGCCCSCSYVEDFQSFFNDSGCAGECQGAGGDYSYDYCDDGGLKEVTECECRAVGGAWAGAGVSCSIYETGGQSNAFTLCTSGGTETDKRWPGACCSDGCTNVCSSDECATIAAGNPDASFYEFFICNSTPVCDRDIPYCEDEVAMRAGNRDQRNGLLVISDENMDSINAKRKNLISKGLFDYGSACIYKDDNTSYKCSKETKKVCDHRNGIWSGLDASGFGHSCSSSVASDLLEYKNNNNSTYASGWELGKSYLGLNARYAGIMYSKSDTKGRGVDYYGNKNTGLPETRILEKSTENVTAGISYAVFVHNSSLSVSYNNISSYLSAINDKNFKFIIPDIETLGFLYNAVRTPEFELNSKERYNNNIDWVGFRKEYYLTSTYLTINNIRDTRYTYIQDMDNGFTSTCSTEKIHNAKGVLLIPLI